MRRSPGRRTARRRGRAPCAACTCAGTTATVVDEHVVGVEALEAALPRLAGRAWCARRPRTPRTLASAAASSCPRRGSSRTRRRRGSRARVAPAAPRTTATGVRPCLRLDVQGDSQPCCCAPRRRRAAGGRPRPSPGPHQETITVSMPVAAISRICARTSAAIGRRVRAARRDSRSSRSRAAVRACPDPSAATRRRGAGRRTTCSRRSRPVAGSAPDRGQRHSRPPPQGR